MINLIPSRARSQVIKEYWLRVIAVWLFLLGTASLLVASLMFPTYMLLRTELVSLRDQVALYAAETASFDQGSSALVGAMSDAQLLLALGTSTASVHMATIEALATDGVLITSYEFETQATTTDITINGVAASRVALAGFRDALENETAFIDATLPISSLRKGTNIDFTLTLKATQS